MIWLELFMQVMPVAFVFAFDKAGRSIPAKMAMIAITTKSSMSVNPCRWAERRCPFKTFIFVFDRWAIRHLLYQGPKAGVNRVPTLNGLLSFVKRLFCGTLGFS